MDKYNVCCFTGHRIIPMSEIALLKARLYKTIEQLAAEGVQAFMSGGALGFDQLAAWCVVELRQANPALKLIMALPCRNQDALWPEDKRYAYQNLLKAADKTLYVSENYERNCMAKRNLYMVQNSAVCVAYLRKTRSGTAQTVRMAASLGLTVIHL